MTTNSGKTGAVLIDLDGVLYKGDTLIPGAVETIRWLKHNGIPHCFLTNTTSRPSSAIQQKLVDIGIDINHGDILTPVIAARNWLLQHTDGPAALFVPEATRADFKGLPVLSGDMEIGATSVVIGDLGEAWDFTTMNRAFRLLMEDPQPVLVALGMTRYWRAEDGLRLDVAPFVKALEHAAGCKARVLGKPASGFFDAGLDMMQASAASSLMIGDDIVGDVQGAKNAGLRAILVRTGKFRPADLQSGIEPDMVIDSIADLPDYWGRLVN